MRKPIYLCILVFALVILATAGTANAPLRCLACIQNLDSCEVVWTSADGYTTCSCPCSCTGNCSGSPAMNLEDVLDGSTMLPESGVLLTEMPSPKYLNALDKGKHFGVVAENVYFADRFGIVTYADGTARAFPLETEEKFAIRGCQGEFIARVHRDKANT